MLSPLGETISNTKQSLGWKSDGRANIIPVAVLLCQLLINDISMMSNIKISSVFFSI